MKHLLALAFITLLASCGNGPQTITESCNSNKQEIIQILTGNSKSCSGLINAALANDRQDKANELLSNTFTTRDGTGKFLQATTILNGKFYTIQKLGDKYIAFKGLIDTITDPKDTTSPYEFEFEYAFINEEGEIIEDDNGPFIQTLTFDINETGLSFIDPEIKKEITMPLENSPLKDSEIPQSDIFIINSFEDLAG